MAIAKTLESRLKRKSIKLAALETKVLKIKASMSKIRSQLRAEVMALATSSDSSGSGSDGETAGAGVDADGAAGGASAVAEIDAGGAAGGADAAEGDDDGAAAAVGRCNRGRPRVIPLGQCPKCWKESKGMPGGVHSFGENCTGVRKRN
jgi:hypothetical protein